MDEWPGNEGDRTFGTSTRAGADAVKHFGYVAEYRHARTLAEVVAWLNEKGPVVIGCNWYEGMAYTSRMTGNVVNLTGAVIGGHCVALNGVDNDRQLVRFRNSWGANWGPDRNGYAWIRFADLERLLFREGGDAIAGLEVALGPVDPPEPPQPEEPEDPPVPPADDTFRYPYQEVMSWATARDKGLLALAGSRYSLLYVVAVRTDRDGTRLDAAWPLYDFLGAGHDTDGTLDDPSLTFLVQYVQARHRADWNA